MSIGLRTVESLISFVGEVDSDDFEALSALGPGVDGVLSTSRIKHHRVAQLAASGMGPAEIAELVGYSKSHICILLKSPAVQGLISSYLENNWTEVEAVVSRARAAASSGITEIHKRIETAPNSIPMKELTAATLGLLDRGGITQKHAVLHFGLSKDDVADLVKGATENSSSRVVEVLAEDQDSDPVDGASRDGAVSELRLVPADSISEVGRDSLSAILEETPQD